MYKNISLRDFILCKTVIITIFILTSMRGKCIILLKINLNKENDSRRTLYIIYAGIRNQIGENNKKRR